MSVKVGDRVVADCFGWKRNALVIKITPTGFGASQGDCPKTKVTNMDKQKQDSWSMLKEELAKKGFGSCQIQEIYSAIVETCDRRGTTSIRI